MKTCRHCGRPISKVGSDGKVSNNWIHTEGRQNGMHRCWPEDTGKPYGLDAEPKEDPRVPCSRCGLPVPPHENGTC